MPTPERRVLILSEIISPYRIPVFNALARTPGLRLHVVFLSETDSVLRQWPIYKDEIEFSYEVLRSTRFRAGKRSLLLNWKLRAALAKFAPDVIICGGYNYVASWDALWWSRSHHVEFVLWCESNRHDDRAGLEWIESLKAYFLSHCDRFVVPGTASAEYLQSLGSAPGSITVAPNAVDNDWFRDHSRAAGLRGDELRARLGLPPQFILFVGRLVAEKGIFDLLEAYACLDPALRSEVGLVFSGDGQARKELEHQAKTLGAPNIVFTGFLHREDLAALYALADVLVLPTHSDPWGLVVNEAMACGLPVIVSNVAGCCCDLVEDGRNGFSIPLCEPDKLRDAISALYEHRHLRPAMSSHSLERIRQFSPEACAHGLATAALAREAGLETSEVQWMTG